MAIALRDGKNLSIEIKKSNRAKKPSIIIDLVGIHAIIPPGYNVKDLVELVQEKKKWLINASEYYERLRLRYDQEHLKANTICFLGKRYWVRIIKDNISSAVVSENLGTITFHVTDKRKFKDDIFKWYKTDCKNYKHSSTLNCL